MTSLHRLGVSWGYFRLPVKNSTELLIWIRYLHKLLPFAYVFTTASFDQPLRWYDDLMRP